MSTLTPQALDALQQADAHSADSAVATQKVMRECTLAICHQLAEIAERLRLLEEDVRSR